MVVFWLVVVPVIVACAFGVFTSRVAVRKGYERSTWFLSGALLGPIALLILLLLRDLRVDTLMSERSGGDVKRVPCGECGEMIPVAAKVCRFCKAKTHVPITSQ